MASLGSGDDEAVLGGGDDTVCGGWGADELVGGPGLDALYGGPGTDAADGLPLQVVAGAADLWLDGTLTQLMSAEWSVTTTVSPP